jgi:hypothetical protein
MSAIRLRTPAGQAYGSTSLSLAAWMSGYLNAADLRFVSTPRIATAFAQERDRAALAPHQQRGGSHAQTIRKCRVARRAFES